YVSDDLFASRRVSDLLQKAFLQARDNSEVAVDLENVGLWRVARRAVFHLSFGTSVVRARDPENLRLGCARSRRHRQITFRIDHCPVEVPASAAGTTTSPR